MPVCRHHTEMLNTLGSCFIQCGANMAPQRYIKYQVNVVHSTELRSNVNEAHWRHGTSHSIWYIVGMLNMQICCRGFKHDVNMVRSCYIAVPVTVIVMFRWYIQAAETPGWMRYRNGMVTITYQRGSLNAMQTRHVAGTSKIKWTRYIGLWLNLI